MFQRGAEMFKNFEMEASYWCEGARRVRVRGGPMMKSMWYLQSSKLEIWSALRNATAERNKRETTRNLGDYYKLNGRSLDLSVLSKFGSNGVRHFRFYYFQILSIDCLQRDRRISVG